MSGLKADGRPASTAAGVFADGAGPVHFAELVNVVRQQTPSAPLDRVEAALTVGEQLTSCADELIGQFVEEARREGCSWTEIGQRIGVSKQAARQRFEDPRRRAPQTWRLNAAAGGCLEAARREAAADGAAEVGTHHQLIGLFHEGVAAAVLEEMGVRAEAVRDAARELFPGGAGGLPGERPPQESAEAREAVRRAGAIAQQAGHGDISTEHLLAGSQLLALWLLWRPGQRASDRDMAVATAALLSVIAWVPFFPALAISGADVEDEPGHLPRVARVPINLVPAALIPASCALGYLLHRRGR